MPPKLNIVRRRTSYTVKIEIDKLQHEIEETSAAIEALKAELKQFKKNYQEEKDSRRKSELKAKHEAGAKKYTDLSSKAEELKRKKYGLEKEYSDLKAKEEEAEQKAKKEAEAAAAAAAASSREGDIVIDTDVIDEDGNSVPLVLNYNDDYDKVVGDFVSLYGLSEEDYDDLLDQVYEVLSDEEGSDDDGDDDYYDDDDEDDYYDDEYLYEEPEEYSLEFGTEIRDPNTGNNANIKLSNADDFREELRKFKEKYGILDVRVMNDLLLRVFAGFRYVEISTFKIDGEKRPLGLFSEDYEQVLDDYAQENNLDDDTFDRLLDECEKGYLFYEDVWKSFVDLRNNGIEINKAAAVKLELEKVSATLTKEMTDIVTEGRKVKTSNPKRFDELLKMLNGKKAVFEEKKKEYEMTCKKLAKLFEDRKAIEKRFEDVKMKNKKYVPEF